MPTDSDMMAPNRRRGLVSGRRAAIAALLAGVMAAMCAASAVDAAPPADPADVPLTARTEPLGRHGHEVQGLPPVVPVMDTTPAPAPVWPAPGTATVSGSAGHKSATSAQRSPVRAGRLPVSVTSPAGGTDVSVELLDRAKVPAAWRNGLVLRLQPASTARPDRTNAPKAAKPQSKTIAVDYGGFRFAVGGDWASRLTLWALPECAVTTPDAPGCEATALPSRNDSAAGTVSADVALTAGASTVVALAADASGPDGDLTATPLAATSTWRSGGSTGDFTWSYPMRVPPVPGELTPSLGVSYSSASVDGRNEASNNQPSWLGEGFELAPGFIERSYLGCDEDMSDSSNNKKKTGDLCWKSDNAMMHFNGKSTELIYESGKGWHGRSEDGSVITKLTGGSNGDDNSEYWQLTTTDGTRYYFGRNNLPGHSHETQSVWTVRAYGNHKNEPCNDTSGTSEFGKSSCDQAWRWNLDYVVDTNGNTMSYWYDKETNAYAANATDDDVVDYTRGGALRRIDYGTWEDRTAPDGSHVKASTVARGQVVFDVADRCKSNCTQHTAASWPDVPWDQECKPGAAQCKGKYAPTFWSTRRLAKVTTLVWDATLSPPALRPVDSWTMGPDFPAPGDGTHAGLWLSSIVHTGLVGGEKALPPVTFHAVPKANRIDTAHTFTNNWQRLGTIVSETGAKTVVTYSLAECTEANTRGLDPASNTKLCYPTVVPDPSDADDGDVTQWWHKYVVRQVSESDTTLVGGHEAPLKNTYYDYPGKPAWHYADDDGFTKKSRKTWSQFRGYDTVETRVGDPGGARTLTVTKYLRGLHGDRTSSGGTRSVTVDASIGSETVYDEDEFAGMVREQTVYNGTTSKPVSRTVNVPWRSTAKASRTINGDVVAAYFVDTQATYQATALGVDGARGWRTTRTHTTFNDADGTIARTQDDGEFGEPGDEQCVTYDYVNNDTKNIIGSPQQVTTTALPCGGKPTSTDDVISDARYAYDGKANGVPPTAGSVTRSDRMKDWTLAGGTTWQKISATKYDVFGRATDVEDIRGNTTTTAYTPATLPPTKVTSKAGPDRWTTVTSLAPAWGLATTTKNINDGVTDVTYDPLGRSSRIWAVGWPKAEFPNKPSKIFEYGNAADRRGYPYVKTSQLNAAGQYVDTFAIFDGFLRPRQSQTRAYDGNRIVSDTIYDSFGKAVATYPAHAEKGTASGTLWWEPEWSLVRVKKTVYDNAGRQTADITLSTDGVTNLVEKWRTTTRHEGDLTRVTPPKGATPTTTLVDAQGRTRELRQHTSPSGVDGHYQATTYAYNRKGQLTETKDPGGNRWSTTYDVLGQIRSQVDPDHGETTFTYTPYGDKETSTDAEGKVLRTEYDGLGRPKALYDDTGKAADLRVTWTYDVTGDGTKVPGQLVGTDRHDNGKVYKKRTVNFSPRMQPLSVDYIVPAEAPRVGRTYSFGYGYSPYDGTPTYVDVPETTDMAAERITTGFDKASGLPTTLSSNWTAVSTYITGQDYNPLGEPTNTFRKTNGQNYVQSIVDYDAVTRSVAHTSVKPELGGIISDRSYEYDPAGNVTSISDTPAVGDKEKQCFTYDTLDRLTSAWTPKTDVSCKVAPSTAGLAGPAPYWTDWTFDDLGNRLTETSHAEPGNTTKTYTHPKPGKDAVQPHAVTTVTTQTADQSKVTTGFQYDKTGNTKNRLGPSGELQTLTWDVEGKLAKVTEGDVQTTHVYDGDGARLLRRDKGGTTLYLPGMEVRTTTGATEQKTTRYYQFAGATIASRTAAGGLDWLFSDTHGTQHLTVNNVTRKATIRRQTPYGSPRGTPPAWPTSKGFVGGDIDPTGLTHIGAREYDPLLGRFISVDPILDPSDPQQWNGYAYANNNPTTFSDPTGAVVDRDRPGCAEGNGGKCGGARTPEPATTDDSPTGGRGKSREGSDTVCNGRCDGSSELWKNIVLPNTMTRENQEKVYHRFWDRYRHFFCYSNGHCMPDADTAMALQFKLIIKDACHRVGGCGKEIDNATNLHALIMTASADGMFGGGEGPAGGGVGVAPGRNGALRPCNSFAPDTRVLMGDGTTKPIRDVRVGDEVLAVDPLSGASAVKKKVTALHDNIDAAFVDVYVINRAGRRSTIHTTRDHLLWNNTRHSWVKAGHLERGDALRAVSARGVRVAGLRTYFGRRHMLDLTVADVHTYYVMASGTPVLVHNCGSRSHDKARGAAGVDEMTDTLEGIVGKGNVWSESHGNGFVFQTPYGKREVDIAVRTSDGNLHLFEVKTGRSNYTRSQRRKDEWLRENFGFETSVIRRDTPCPICK